jgi:hypothetical protein
MLLYNFAHNHKFLPSNACFCEQFGNQPFSPTLYLFFSEKARTKKKMIYWPITIFGRRFDNYK